MSELTVRTVLRLIAVVTMLGGFIVATQSLITLVGTSRFMHGAADTAGVSMNVSGFGEMGLMLILGQAVIVVEGWLLYLMSAALAQRIVR